MKPQIRRIVELPEAMLSNMVMMKAMVVVLLAVFCYAQQPESQLTFEVASIKPSAPPEGGRMVMGARGGPGSADPIRFTGSNMSLTMLITMAYDLKPYQLSAPSWLSGERFDIAAKVPPGATREQFRIMLQNLLAERFKLEIHRETKELPVFELVVGKGGPKFKESADQSETVPGAAPPPPPPPGGPIMVGRDGVPQGLAGRTMMMMSPGRARLTAYKENMGWLAARLSSSAGRPVLDATGLTKKYDFTLDFAPEGGGMGPGMVGMGPGGGGGGGVFIAQGPGPGGGGPADRPADVESAPTLATALQEQLGLKLEAKKGPVSIVVVDKIEKVPTEN